MLACVCFSVIILPGFSECVTGESVLRAAGGRRGEKRGVMCET